MAPGIVEVKRRVERERVKDGLRAWLERKARRVGAEAEKTRECCGGEGRISVRRLVQRFTNGRWGEKRKERQKCGPPRAHVYGLRKFWEGLARSQSIQA